MTQGSDEASQPWALPSSPFGAMIQCPSPSGRSTRGGLAVRKNNPQRRLGNDSLASAAGSDDRARLLGLFSNP